MKRSLKKLTNLPLYGVAYALMDPGTVNLGPTGNFTGLVNIRVGNIVPALISIVLIVAALVALLFLIIGGIKWITSGGDKAQVESARGTVTAALIGLMVIFCAWAVIQLIGYFFGIDILQFKIPNFTGT